MTKRLIRWSFFWSLGKIELISIDNKSLCEDDGHCIYTHLVSHPGDIVSQCIENENSLYQRFLIQFCIQMCVFSFLKAFKDSLMFDINFKVVHKKKLSWKKSLKVKCGGNSFFTGYHKLSNDFKINFFSVPL